MTNEHGSSGPDPAAKAARSSAEAGPLDRAVLCIGAGTMAQAVLLGAINAGSLDPRSVSVAARTRTRLGVFDAAGCGTSTDAAASLRGAAEDAVVVLAVKPQSLPELAEQVGGCVGERLVLSMLAGVSCDRVRRALGGRCRVIRTMPNTPASVGLGVTGVVPGEGVGGADLSIAERLFGGVGDVVRLASEEQMPAFTLLAGSGPAYVFYLAEAMERAARAHGFNEGDARRIVSGTIRGAAGLQLREGDPAALRASVTSKGGVTAAAVAELDRAGVADAVSRAIAAGVAHDAVLARRAEAPGGNA